MPCHQAITQLLLWATSQYLCIAVPFHDLLILESQTSMIPSWLHHPHDDTGGDCKTGIQPKQQEMLPMYPNMHASPVENRTCACTRSLVPHSRQHGINLKESVVWSSFGGTSSLRSMTVIPIETIVRLLLTVRLSILNSATVRTY